MDTRPRWQMNFFTDSISSGVMQMNLPEASDRVACDEFGNCATYLCHLKRQ
jgi:hypothetical protein